MFDFSILPLWATIIITSNVLLLALLLPLVTLAKVTSGIILFVFTLVNFSSWKIQQIKPDPDTDAIGLPNWLPFLGGVGSVLALGFQISQGLVFSI
jgi:hypothetical protein